MPLDPHPDRPWTSALVVSFGLLAGCASPGSDREAPAVRSASLSTPLAAPAQAPAGTTDQPRLPADYVALGLTNAPSLEALRARLAAAEEQPTRAGALDDPVLTYTEFLEELETRGGPAERRLRLDQRFPWPGVRAARTDVAEARVEVAVGELAAAESALAAVVESAWFELALARERARLAEQEFALLESFVPLVESRILTGEGGDSRLQLEIALERARVEKARCHGRVAPLSARLAVLCGMPAGSETPTATLVEVEASIADLAEERRWFERALDHSPELARERAELDAAGAERALAEMADRPALQVGLEYLAVGEALDSSTPDSGDDPLAVRVGVGLPLWREAYAATARQAERRERSARLELESGRLELEADLVEVEFELADARRRLELFRSSLLPRAREAYELNMSAYTVGDVRLTDVIESERVMLDLELEAWGALADLGQTRARLRALAGAEPAETERR